jgi:hypothetical protein
MNLLNVPPFFSVDYWDMVVQNALGCMIGSFLSIYVAFLIYRSSLNQMREDAATRERRDHANTRTYFTQTLNSMLSVSTTQLKNLKDFLHAISTDPTEYPLLPYTPMYEFKRVSESQNLDKILAAFTSIRTNSNETIHHFSDLIANVDYINAQMDIIVKQLEKAQLYDNDRKKQLKAAYGKIFEYVGNLLSLQRYDYTPPVRQALESVVTDYKNTNGVLNDLKFVYESFIIPLNASMNHLYDNAERGPVVMQIITMTDEALRTYKEMIKQIQAVAADVKEATGALLENGIKPLQNNASHFGFAVD